MARTGKQIVEERIPSCTPAERRHVAAFLDYLRNCTELSINDHRVLRMTTPNKQTDRWIAAMRDRLATINWLIAMNDQRRETQDVNPTRSA